MSRDFQAYMVAQIPVRLVQYTPWPKQELQELEKLQQRLNELVNLSLVREKIKTQIDDAQKNVMYLGEKLSKERNLQANILVDKLIVELKELGMKNARVTYDFIKETPTQNGLESASIMFSANLGEPLKPLKAIISGGELSRVMLALKVVMGQLDNTPTMVFDEIDTGISGVTSEVVAKKLAKVSLNHQILVITHSSQIASMADTHYLIQKQEENGKTSSVIKKLNYSERVLEIARFMAGENTLNTVTQGALALLNEQDNFKKSLKNC